MCDWSSRLTIVMALVVVIAFLRRSAMLHALGSAGEDGGSIGTVTQPGATGEQSVSTMPRELEDATSGTHQLMKEALSSFGGGALLPSVCLRKQPLTNWAHPSMACISGWCGSARFESAKLLPESIANSEGIESYLRTASGTTDMESPSAG